MQFVKNACIQYVKPYQIYAKRYAMPCQRSVKQSVRVLKSCAIACATPLEESVKRWRISFSEKEDLRLIEDQCQEILKWSGITKIVKMEGNNCLNNLPITIWTNLPITIWTDSNNRTNNNRTNNNSSNNKDNNSLKCKEDNSNHSNMIRLYNSNFSHKE